jgi:hypothetical protein
MTKYSRLSRFGMMFKPLTESLGEELLTLYLAGFHAKTSAPQEKELESKESEAECGNTWQESLKKCSQLTLTLKTPLCSALEDSVLSSKTLPRWGSMQSGELYQRQMPERRTVETVFGFSLPTPTASDATSGAVIGKNDTYYTTTNGMPRKVNQNGKDGSVGLGRLVKMWPTPKANEPGMTAKTTGRGVEKSTHLTTQVALAEGIIDRKTGRLFATPQARDFRTGQQSRWENLKRTRNLNDQIGGQLNPTWVEWLMGWPLGWTDLKPLEMDKFQQWQQQHGVK